jgi:preprotein translocase SecE subunit
VSEVKQDNRMVRYFKGTRAEVRKVHWPSRKDARSLTTVVLVVTIIMTIFLGLIVSPLASTFAGALFVQQSPVAIAIAVVVAIVGIIGIAIWLRRQ